MLIPSIDGTDPARGTSLSRRVNANSQPVWRCGVVFLKLIKKGEC